MKMPADSLIGSIWRMFIFRYALPQLALIYKRRGETRPSTSFLRVLARK
jgi:hypothetical protein